MNRFTRITSYRVSIFLLVKCLAVPASAARDMSSKDVPAAVSSAVGAGAASSRLDVVPATVLSQMMSFLSLKDDLQASRANRSMHAISLLPQAERFKREPLIFTFYKGENKIEERIARFSRWWRPIERRLPPQPKVHGQGAKLQLMHVTPHTMKALPLTAASHIAELELVLDEEGKSLIGDADFNARVGAMRNLQRLTLGGFFPAVFDYLGALITQLQESTRAVLTKLRLVSLELTATKVESIAPALMLLPKLQELALFANPDLGAVGVLAVINALSSSARATITSLDLSNVGLIADNAPTLATALAQLPNLQKLILSDNRGLGVGVATAINALSSSARATITSLYLSNVGLTADNAPTFAKALAQLPNLQKLILSNNPDLGAAGVLAAINASPSAIRATTTVLELIDVGLTADNVALLVPAFASLPNLQELVLSSNPRLGAAGVITAVNALSPSAKVKIETLHLFNVGLATSNAATLAPVLAQLPNLKNLFVNDNPLYAAALRVLASSLPPSAVIFCGLGKISGTRAHPPSAEVPDLQLPPP